ncbi:hypothetical protein [Thermus sediminis]|uniref:hypothetical protein n=1 Tax=Thermus sediminis TaxID=1761908 RepID=UPI001E3B8A9A|nr:hypothetical protein [Thermus sediminis]
MRSATTLLLIALLGAGLAHRAVPEVKEAYQAEARLFALDNRPGHSRLLALDLPGGKAVAELSLPPMGMSLVATPSGRYLLVSRGRDTDRQWLTAVWTGKEEGRWSRPVIAKSLLLGRGWNIGHGQEAYTHGGRLLAFAERDAVAFLFPEESLAPEAAFQAERLRLPNPDHYHVVEAPEGVYLTLLGRGQVVLYPQGLGGEEGGASPAPLSTGRPSTRRPAGASSPAPGMSWFWKEARSGPAWPTPWPGSGSGPSWRGKGPSSATRTG